MNRAVLLGLVLLGALFGAGGMWLAERAAPGDLSGADRARVETVVRDYVLAHPELLPEAMDRLQQKESAKAVGAHRGAIEEPYGNAWIGNPDGDVTLSSSTTIIAAIAAPRCPRSRSSSPRTGTCASSSRSCRC